jgi:hypothetical protein
MLWFKSIHPIFKLFQNKQPLAIAVRAVLIASLIPGSMIAFHCQNNSTILEPEPPTVLERPCVWNGIDSIDYLDSVMCSSDFEKIQGTPAEQVTAHVKSLKVIYDIVNDHVYFTNSKLYPYHYYFCSIILGYKQSNEQFNIDQYGCGNNRIYCLGSVNYYEDTKIYTLEFFPSDCVSADYIKTVYQKVSRLVYFSPILKFLPSSTALLSRAASLSKEIPVITQDEIFAGQIYQPLNTKESYGYLRYVDMKTINSTRLNRHDIVVLNGIPADLAPVAGVITTVYQTPLAHINVLSHNRGTPNMMYKNALTDTNFTKLSGLLVHLKVQPDNFSLQPASLSDAEAFWAKSEPTRPYIPMCNDDTSGLFELSQIDRTASALVGAKAANFAELTHIPPLDSLGVIPVPEGAFAIPFFYYRQHLDKNGITPFIDSMLTDTQFLINETYRKKTLQLLQERIINAPADTEFIHMVDAFIRSHTGATSIRFRSSTNVEDIPDFNGAGLYTSNTAVLGDPKKSIDMAIKKTWASLWLYDAFEERQYFKIDQHTIAMGILVHSAFKGDDAGDVDGVAITRNLYYADLPGMTINVQGYGVNVRNPPAGFMSDQFIVHTFTEDPYTNPSIEYLAHSNIMGGKPVLSNDQIITLVKYLEAIKTHFCPFYNPRCFIYNASFAMDVEFKYEGNPAKLYFRQVRPYK